MDKTNNHYHGNLQLNLLGCGKQIDTIIMKRKQRLPIHCKVIWDLYQSKQTTKQTQQQLQDQHRLHQELHGINNRLQKLFNLNTTQLFNLTISPTEFSINQLFLQKNSFWLKFMLDLQLTLGSAITLPPTKTFKILEKFYV